MAQQMNELCRYNLRGIYADIEDFFTRAARVEREPTLPEFIQLVKHITNNTTVVKALPDVLQVRRTNHG